LLFERFGDQGFVKASVMVSHRAIV
jgi:hypothetical protein